MVTLCEKKPFFLFFVLNFGRHKNLRNIAGFFVLVSMAKILVFHSSESWTSFAKILVFHLPKFWSFICQNFGLSFAKILVMTMGSMGSMGSQEKIWLGSENLWSSNMRPMRWSFCNWIAFLLYALELKRPESRKSACCMGSRQNGHFKWSAMQ